MISAVSNTTKNKKSREEIEKLTKEFIEKGGKVKEIIDEERQRLNNRRYNPVRISDIG